MSGGRPFVLVVTTMAAFATPFMAGSVNIALPRIGREFGLDPVSLAWITTGYLLATAICLVPFGKLADTRGRGPVFTVGLAAYAVLSGACAVAPSAATLILARILQGAAASMVFSTSAAILTAAFPAERRGLVLGIHVTAVYLGTSVGPFVGGLLTEHVGWRSIFALTAVLAAAGTVAAARWLDREWRPSPERFDWGGVAMYAVGLAAALLGLPRVPSGPGVALVAAGVGMLVLFVRWETRASQPVMAVRLFVESRVFAFSNLAALASYAATFGVSFLLSVFLQHVLGLSADTAGTILVAQAAMQALVSPFAGRLSDRIGSRAVATFGMAVTAGGLAYLATITAAVTVTAVMACLAVLGVGFGCFSSPNMSAIMGSVDRRSYGAASATLATMRMVGQTASMGITMLVLATVVGGTPLADAPPARIVEATRLAFGVFAVLCAAATAASLARGGRRPTDSGVDPVLSGPRG